MASDDKVKADESGEKCGDAEGSLVGWMNGGCVGAGG